VTAWHHGLVADEDEVRDDPRRFFSERMLAPFAEVILRSNQQMMQQMGQQIGAMIQPQLGPLQSALAAVSAVQLKGSRR
jgi:hypothetical protein